MCHTVLSDMRKAWACLHADHLGLRLTDASTWAILSGVQTEDDRPGGFFHLTEPSSRHCLTMDCIWRWGFLLIPFTAKSALSLCNWPRPNKQFHSTHVLLFSSAPCALNLKVTVYVQIPALCDTLAAKHVTKILKCFTISAAPCLFISYGAVLTLYKCICFSQLSTSDFSYICNMPVARPFP